MADAIHRAIEALGPGDHLCCIYETEREHRRVVTPFLRQGLERNEKVFYIVDDRTAEQILDYLHEAGVEVEAYLARGQLKVLTSTESYVRGGIFDPEAMITLLRKETRKALDEGYAALRVTGEMTWALRDLPGVERLLEYENELNNFVPNHPALAICQYDRRRFAPEILLDVVLKTHPIAVVGTAVYENLYYIPPDELMGGEPEAAELRHWIRNLAEHKRATDTLRESEKRYRNFFQTSRDAIFITSKDGRWIDMNAATVDLFGYENEEELRQVAIFDLYARPADRRKHIRTIEERGFTQEFPIDLCKKDGSVIHTLITSVPVRDDEGDLIGYQGTIRDITERKRTEKALREAEEQFRLIAETSADIIFQLDLEGRITYCSPSVERILGFAPDKVIGVHLRRFLPTKELSQVMENFQRAATGEQLRTVEAEIVNDAGKLLHVEATLTPIVQNGQVVGVQGAARDITARRETEAQTRFQAHMLNAVGQAVVATDPEGAIIYWNRAAERLYGWSEEEVLGRDITEVTPVAASQEQAREIMAHLRAGETWSGEFPVQRRDGTTFLAIVTDTPIHDEDGNLTAIIGITTDITERKRAEETLQERVNELTCLHRVSHDMRANLSLEALCQRLVEHLVEAMRFSEIAASVIELDGKRFTSENYVEGLTHGLHADIEGKDGLRGQLWVYYIEEKPFLIPEEQDLIDNTAEALSMWLAREWAEAELRRHRNRLQDMVDARTAELSERVEEIARLNKGMVNLLEDQQIVNRRLRETTEDLEKANEELESFAYVVSHDLKAPLRGISQLTEWLSQDYAGAFDEKGEEMLELLTERTHRMHDLIDGILTYSRAGRIQERKQKVNTHQLVQEIVEMLAPPEEIEITVDEGLPAVQGEPTRLRQLFQNVIENAIKFIDKPEGHVEVTCTDKRDRWRFGVADNGPGIAEEYRDKIFKMFQTLRPRDKGGGTGVGLAVTKKIVETHGGRIWVESTVGEGSTFYFTLPKQTGS